MENKSHKIIFDHGECISEDVLLAYANNTLSAKEKHIMEKHTLGCDMCADALEGIMLMKHPEQLKGIVESLNKKIRGAGEERKPIILWMDTRVRVAIAAGLALLIGFFFLFNNNFNKVSEDKTVSDNLKQKEEVNKPLSDKEEFKKTDSTIASSDRPVVLGKKQDIKDTKQLEKSGEVSVTTSENANAGPGGNSHAGTGGDKLRDQRFGDGLTKTDQAPPPKDAQDEQQTIVGLKDVTTNDRSKSADKKIVAQNKPETVLDKDAKGKDDESNKSQENETTVSKEVPKSPVQTYTVTTEDDKFFAYQKNDAPKKEEKEKNTSKGENRKDKKKQTEYAESQKQPDEKSNLGGMGNVGYTSSPQSTTLNTTTVNGTSTGTVSPNPVPQNVNSNQDIVLSEVATDTTKTFVSGKLDSISYKTEVSGGEKKYESKDYNQAVLLFTKALEKNQNDRKALYYLGDSYLQLNKPDLAIVQFDKLIKLGTGDYYDGARYDKATALMKQNKNAEAKVLLMDIEKTSTQYESRAKKSLDKIK